MQLLYLLSKRHFFHYYQPIVNLYTDEIEGYEALFRSAFFQTPEEAYQFAIRKKKLFELDTHSIQKALCVYTQHNKSGSKDARLFLNTYPSTILHSDFVPFMLHLLERCPIPASRIVLEIVEHERISDFPALIKKLNNLRKMGLLIAVDDFGKGSDNISRTIEIDADYIKLDRYFSIDLDLSRKKRAYVEFLVDYCNQFAAKLVFEGLETAADIHNAQKLGVRYAQGFAIGKPWPISETMRGDYDVRNTDRNSWRRH